MRSDDSHCMYYRPAPQMHIYFPFSFLVTVRSRHPETPKINRSGGCDSFSVEGAIFTPSQHAMISLEIGIHRTLHTRPSSVLRCDHPVFADGQTRPPEPLTQSANMAALLFGTQLKLAWQTLRFLHHHLTTSPASFKAHWQWHAHSLLSSSLFSAFSLWPTLPRWSWWQRGCRTSSSRKSSSRMPQLSGLLESLPPSSGTYIMFPFIQSCANEML